MTKMIHNDFWRNGMAQFRSAHQAVNSIDVARV